jgi:hypothetical protein
MTSVPGLRLGGLLNRYCSRSFLANEVRSLGRMNYTINNCGFDIKKHLTALVNRAFCTYQYPVSNPPHFLRFYLRKELVHMH